VATSIPDVMQVVGEVVRFQATPKETRVMVVRMIFIYIKGTIEFVFWYPKGNEMTMVSYIDVDLEGSIDNRRSASGAAF
jgi:hypothetical protein